MRDPFNPLPQHEPEVLAARERRNLDLFHAAKMLSREVVVDGVRVVGRREDASTLERMAARLYRLPSQLRRNIHTIYYEPKASMCLVAIHHYERAGYRRLVDALCVALAEEFESFSTMYLYDPQGLVGVVTRI